MAQRTNQQQLMAQVVRAREALGNALGLVQDINAAEFDLKKVVAHLATSVKLLFKSQESQLSNATPIRETMKHLQTILQMMQDKGQTDPRMQAATTTIARILAILFPVYKELSAPSGARQHPGGGASPKQTPAAKRKQPSSDERRSTPRKSMEVDLGGQSDSNFFTGFTTDISSGGLFVATFDAPQIGHVVNLNFHLPKGPVMSIEGEVCWCREYNELTPDMPPGVGIRFLHLSAGDANAINAYIKRVEPMFYDD